MQGLWRIWGILNLLFWFLAAYTVPKAPTFTIVSRRPSGFDLPLGKTFHSSWLLCGERSKEWRRDKGDCGSLPFPVLTIQ